MAERELVTAEAFGRRIEDAAAQARAQRAVRRRIVEMRGHDRVRILAQDLERPARALEVRAHQGAGPGGGMLAELRFAVVGDTRPMNLDDTANYPAAIARAIWVDVEAEHPPFALTTGDYMFATPGNAEARAQLDLYLGPRRAYS